MTLVDLLVRPVAYHPALARLIGSVPAAVMLSQAIYWQQRVPVSRPFGCPGQGWWYHTAEEWELETALSEGMQLTARKILRKTSFWLEKATGMPRRLWFRVDFEELEKILKNQQFPGYRGTSVRQAREQDGRFSGYMVTEIPGALQAESTSDINTETTTGITREQAAEGGGIFLEKRIDQISLQEEYLSLLKRYGDARSYVALVSAKRKQWQNQGNLSARDNEQLSEWRKKEEVAEIRRKNNHQIQKEDIRYEEVASEDFQRNLESLPSEIRRAIQGAVNSQSQNKTVP